MWDVVILVALAHPEWAVKKKFTTPSENIQRNIDIYTGIQVQKITDDFWKSMDKL